MAKLATLKNLEMLGLQRTKVDDQGLVALLALPKLREVWLNDDHITNGGLAELKRLKNLKLLSIESTDVTHPACERLRRALPNTDVRWYARRKDVTP